MLQWFGHKLSGNNVMKVNWDFKFFYIFLYTTHGIWNYRVWSIAIK